jgi:tRNA (mo5U34)-methyltransferase
VTDPSIPASVDGTTEPPFPLSAEKARALVASFPFWYHNIYLGNGVHTAGRGHHEDVWDHFSKALPASFSGLSVLDVGTNAGYFALQAKVRSARHVVGTEFVQIFLDQAEAIRQIWGAEIDYRLLDAHDVAKLGQTFDIVVFAGILYHLKNPLQVIEDLGKMCTDAILLETEFIADDPRNCLVVRQGVPAEPQVTHKGVMKFLETTELNGDPTNWWVPDTECVMGMLRTAGFVHISRPVVMHGCRLVLVASKKKDSLLNIDAFGR